MPFMNCQLNYSFLSLNVFDMPIPLCSFRAGAPCTAHEAILSQRFLSRTTRLCIQNEKVERGGYTDLFQVSVAIAIKKIAGVNSIPYAAIMISVALAVTCTFSPAGLGGDK